jgi:multidrug efflux pump subunit AcrB
MHTRLLAVAVLCAIAVPVVAASIAPPEYRQCMRTAIDTRERTLIDSMRQFNDEQEQALEERRQKYVEAYDSETDQEIRDRQREADRDYGRRLADIKDARRDRDRDANRQYADAKSECRDLRRGIDKQNRVSSNPHRIVCGGSDPGADTFCLR